MMYVAPEKSTYHMVGYNELVKELGITEDEAKFLLNKMTFDFWFDGNDTDYNTTKKWTVEGDETYSDFSLKDYFLAMICDYVGGAHFIGMPELAKEIEDISNLHKHLHFAKNRITIKEKYYGVWKNAWKF